MCGNLRLLEESHQVVVKSTLLRKYTTKESGAEDDSIVRN